MIADYEKFLTETEIPPSPRISLRKFSLDDCADVFEYGSDETTVKYLVWDGLKTMDDAKKNIAEYYLSRPGIYAIILTETSKCIGCISLDLHPHHEKADVGYVLNRSYWNKGYMTEALASIIAFCFEVLQLNRVEASHYVGNEASGRVMEKCGMRREGLGIEEEKIKGVFRDIVHYGITRSQYFSLDNIIL